MQLELPCAAKHAFPQPPQLFSSREVSTSQPFEDLPSQSASGVLHDDTPQTPFKQLGVPPTAWHAEPQAPQLSTFFVVSTSHPSATWLSQSANPVAHLMEQAPRAQVAVSLLVEQGLPQPPQFAASESELTSQPSFGSPLQSAQPGLQLAIAHTPFEHSGLAFGGVQAALQAPQLSVSTFLLVSHPFVASPSQSPRGGTHVSILQTPPSHFAAAFANVHTLPHVPQLVASACVCTSQPSLDRPLQSV